MAAVNVVPSDGVKSNFTFVTGCCVVVDCGDVVVVGGIVCDGVVGYDVRIIVEASFDGLLVVWSE